MSNQDRNRRRPTHRIYGNTKAQKPALGKIIRHARLSHHRRQSEQVQAVCERREARHAGADEAGDPETSPARSLELGVDHDEDSQGAQRQNLDGQHVSHSASQSQPVTVAASLASQVAQDTYHGPVDPPLQRLTPKDHVHPRDQIPNSEQDDANEVKAEPHALHGLGMVDERVVSSRQAKAGRRGEQEGSEDQVVG